MSKNTDERLKIYQEKVGREQDQMPIPTDRKRLGHASTMKPRKGIGGRRIATHLKPAKGKCTVCFNHPVLRPTCTHCKGTGEEPEKTAKEIIAKVAKLQIEEKYGSVANAITEVCSHPNAAIEKAIDELPTYAYSPDSGGVIEHRRGGYIKLMDVIHLLRDLKPEQAEAETVPTSEEKVSILLKQIGKQQVETDRLNLRLAAADKKIEELSKCREVDKETLDDYYTEIASLKDREKIILDSASQAHEDADRLESRLSAADEVSAGLADAGNEKDAEIAEAKNTIKNRDTSLRVASKMYASEESKNKQLEAKLAEARDAIAKGFDKAAQRLLRETDKLRYETENKQLRAALERIQTWAKAYPLKIFPEPDLKKVAKALKDNGLTIDAVAASNMRYVLKGVSDIVDEALK